MSNLKSALIERVRNRNARPEATQYEYNTRFTPAQLELQGRVHQLDLPKYQSPLSAANALAGMPDYVIPGVSISILARAVGLSPGGMSRIMSGDRKPKLDNLRAIAAYLQIPVDEVLRLIDQRAEARRNAA